VLSLQRTSMLSAAGKPHLPSKVRCTHWVSQHLLGRICMSECLNMQQGCVLCPAVHYSDKSSWHRF
jgi:hypothetical protein